MITLHIILGIIIIHFIGDFILQTDKEAKNKSSSWYYLLSHTLSYSTIWIVIGSLYGVVIDNVWLGFQFGGITFICHTITDYFTSRLNKKLMPIRDYKENREEGIKWYSFPYGESYHKFFIGIGGDQVLHYIQLFLTYYFLTN